MKSESLRDLTLLEQIESNPDVTQANLADQLGVAVGTVNWHLRRLIEKGYVKVKRAQRRKLKYIITPEGIALRARLTVDYIENSFRLYRKTRERILELLEQVKENGYQEIRIIGKGGVGSKDILDVCYLTCIEQGIPIVESEYVPCLLVEGWKVKLVFTDGDNHAK
ncbi:MAG: winged helix-turn-helix transcriptional regulator [Anaerolineales bacterium]|nr:winged helix-turn-helix transcriptional regulator [Anaerolineales bacterium]